MLDVSDNADEADSLLLQTLGDEVKLVQIDLVRYQYSPVIALHNFPLLFILCTSCGAEVIWHLPR